MPNYLLWSETPYAGEKNPPTNPVEPLAGSWSTYYTQNITPMSFQTLGGEIVNLDIPDPNMIDWIQQLSMVEKTLEDITRKQIEIARYWGTGVPTKQFTPIIDRLIDTYGASPPRAARILAAVNAGFNDTLVLTWFLKYYWNVARPDQYDQKLASILCTPRFPTYTAGHAGVAGCAEALLSYFFPAEATRLHQLAEECAISRLYAGVHFPIDLEAGLEVGRKVGQAVLNVLKSETDSSGKPIDVPYTTKRDADLPPPPYRQVIPFKFDESCTSLVRKTKH